MQHQHNLSGNFPNDYRDIERSRCEIESVESRLMLTGLQFELQTFAVGVDPFSVVVADLNGDSRLDIAAALNVWDSNSVSVLLGNGDGTFQPRQIAANNSNPLYLAVGDMNHDGKPDLVTSNQGYGIVSVLLGNGDGTFQNPMAFPTKGAPTAIAVVDVNADSKLDVVTACAWVDGGVDILLGNGDGTLQPYSTFATGGNPWCMDVSDLNGDNKPDIITANSGINTHVNTASVLLGNGDGTFQPQRVFSIGEDAMGVAVSDVNGDSKPDIMTANRGSDDVSVLLGTGDGMFQTQSKFPAGSDPISIAVADLDGDSKSDVVTANMVSRSISVLRGNGDGTFQTPQLFAVGSSPYWVALADLNSDGRRDIIVANNDSNDVSVLLNWTDLGLAAEDDAAATDEDLPIDVNVLANDTFADSGTVAITIMHGPSHGLVQVVEGNQLRYAPEQEYYGSDSFEYTLSDGTGHSDSAVVRLTVNPVNDAPVLDPIPDQSVREGSFSTIQLAAHDVDGPTQAWHTIYSTDFSTDPGWTSTDPSNLRWDSFSQTYYGRQVNGEGTYAFKEIPGFDSSKEWWLEFDSKINWDDWSAGLTFGLYRSDMVYPSGAIVDQSIADGGRFICLTGVGAQTWSYNPPWADGTWYSYAVKYDPGSHTLTATVSNHATGAAFMSLTTTGVNLPSNLNYLGVSRKHMIGNTGSSPSATVDFNFDNVTLYQKRIARGPKFSLAPGTPDWINIDQDTGTLTMRPVDGPSQASDVGVIVTDDDGASDEQWLHIDVENVAPAATITGAPDQVLAKQPITLGSIVFDPSVADTAMGFRYLWSVKKNDQAYPLPADVVVDAPSLTFVPDGSGAYEVTITVWDKDDGVGQTQVTVQVIPAADCVLSGLVWLDFNDDGLVDFGEKGISGVWVELTGTDDLGNSVALTQQTDGDGAYIFQGLRPGTYSIHEIQPEGYVDGPDSMGTPPAVILANDTFSQIQISEDVQGINYNFGERPMPGSAIQPGQAATIGFWQNKNGQALIKSFDGGGTSTQLGDWLAATLPNLFGVTSGSSNLAGMTNAAVAAMFQQRFVLKGIKLDAQVMATALSVYATSSSLGGSDSARYGFQSSEFGLAVSTFSVGSNGAAFGVANETTITVLDLLLLADQQAVNGVMYGGDATLRSMANNVFSAVNEAGDI